MSARSVHDRLAGVVGELLRSGASPAHVIEALAGMAGAMAATSGVEVAEVVDAVEDCHRSARQTMRGAAALLGGGGAA